MRLPQNGIPLGSHSHMSFEVPFFGERLSQGHCLRQPAVPGQLPGGVCGERGRLPHLHAASIAIAIATAGIGCGSTTWQTGALVNGAKDENSRNPSSFILSHTQVCRARRSFFVYSFFVEEAKGLAFGLIGQVYGVFGSVSSIANQVQKDIEVWVFLPKTWACRFLQAGMGSGIAGMGTRG